MSNIWQFMNRPRTPFKGGTDQGVGYCLRELEKAKARLLKFDREISEKVNAAVRDELGERTEGQKEAARRKVIDASRKELESLDAEVLRLTKSLQYQIDQHLSPPAKPEARSLRLQLWQGIERDLDAGFTVDQALQGADPETLMAVRAELPRYLRRNKAGDQQIDEALSIVDHAIAKAEDYAGPITASLEGDRLVSVIASYLEAAGSALNHGPNDPRTIERFGGAGLLWAAAFPDEAEKAREADKQRLESEMRERGPQSGVLVLNEQQRARQIAEAHPKSSPGWEYALQYPDDGLSRLIEVPEDFRQEWRARQEASEAQAASEPAAETEGVA